MNSRDMKALRDITRRRDAFEGLAAVNIDTADGEQGEHV